MTVSCCLSKSHAFIQSVVYVVAGLFNELDYHHHHYQLTTSIASSSAKHDNGNDMNGSQGPPPQDKIQQRSGGDNQLCWNKQLYPQYSTALNKPPSTPPPTVDLSAFNDMVVRMIRKHDGKRALLHVQEQDGFAATAKVRVTLREKKLLRNSRIKRRSNSVDSDEGDYGPVEQYSPDSLLFKDQGHAAPPQSTKSSDRKMQ